MPYKNVIKLPTRQERFYKQVLQILLQHDMPILIGGSLALAHFMHLPRKPKDLDIFLRHEDCEAVLGLLAEYGYRTEILHPHWIGKAYLDDLFIDFIFSSGNGVAQVDESWFQHSVKGKLFGMPVRVCAPEDIIWSKAFIMDRERFDGADIAHLIRDAGGRIDWERLVDRFEHHWRVLLAHLLLFQYIYPSDKVVPKSLIERLVSRVGQELEYESELVRLCQGTLLSRDQYLSDVELHGYSDGRVLPHGPMSDEEVRTYTEAVRAEQAEKEAEKHRLEEERRQKQGKEEAA